MATLINPDGTKQFVLPESVVKGFRLDELYSLLDCTMVQMIRMADGKEMWLDEEAKLKDQPLAINIEATTLLQASGGIKGDYVLGKVLICEPGEVP